MYLLAAALKCHVEPEGLGGKQTGHHGLHAEILAQPSRQLTAIGLGIGKTERELVASLLFQVSQYHLQIVSQFN